MHEFRWQIPGAQASSVKLRLHARNGWFGIKSLYVDDRRIYRRLWISGIAHRFQMTPGGPTAHLRMHPDRAGQWRPALFVDGREIPEQSGGAAPAVPPRPPIISIVTGLTYLLMLVSLVMLFSIIDMLEAVKQPHADRKLVLTLRDPAMPDLLAVEPAEVGAVPQGQPQTWDLECTGGQPPLRWLPSRKRWPKGMILDETTGRAEFAPRNASDYNAEFVVRDARGDLAFGALAIVVDPRDTPRPGWPTISTAQLPVATVGKAYHVCLESDRVAPTYTWKQLSGALPSGLKLDREGCLVGTPGFRSLGKLSTEHVGPIREGRFTETLRDALEGIKVRLEDEARILSTSSEDVRLITDGARRLILRMQPGGVRVLDGSTQFPITVSLIDTSYLPGQDIRRWIIPFLATAVSLLGYWNMRRWGVWLLAVLLILQIGCLVAGLAPIAVAGVVVQAVLLILGLLHLGKMQ